MTLTKHECDDAWAFYEHHRLQHLLEKLVKRCRMSHADRDDALAHVRAEFPKLLRRSHPRDPQAWATSVLGREVRKWVRSRRGELAKAAPLTAVPEAIASGDDPGREAALQVLLPVVEEQVDRLPARERRVLRAVCYEGKRLADLARETGEPQSTLASRRDRGFVHLTARLRRARRSNRGLEAAYRLLRGHFH